MTDPPEWAAGEVGRCVNTATWPVLAGPPDCTELMLSSPVILYDHAEIAAESAGQLFDSTEIDEILTLRTMTLTDDEKRAARATDPRAAELLDRLDHLPPEMLERMHGAIRYLNPAGSPDARARDRAGVAGGRAGVARAGPGGQAPCRSGPNHRRSPWPAARRRRGTGRHPPIRPSPARRRGGIRARTVRYPRTPTTS